MLTYTEELNAHFKDLSLEIEAIRHTFSKITEALPGSFRPFAIFFGKDSEKEFIITSRPVKDENDYYTAISEMLFAYSSIKATGVIFAIDATKTSNNDTYDALEIYAACDHFCTIYTLPYAVDSGKLIWSDHKFDTYTVDALEKAYDTTGQFHATLEIYEALYLHTHMDDSVFDFSKLKDFYKRNDFEFVSIKQSESENNSD